MCLHRSTGLHLKTRLKRVVEVQHTDEDGRHQHADGPHILYKVPWAGLLVCGTCIGSRNFGTAYDVGMWVGTAEDRV